MRENESVPTGLVDSRGEKGGAYGGLRVRDTNQREKERTARDNGGEEYTEKVQEIANVYGGGNRGRRGEGGKKGNG